MSILPPASTNAKDNAATIPSVGALVAIQNKVQKLGMGSLERTMCREQAKSRYAPRGVLVDDWLDWAVAEQEGGPCHQENAHKGRESEQVIIPFPSLTEKKVCQNTRPNHHAATGISTLYTSQYTSDNH